MSTLSRRMGWFALATAALGFSSLCPAQQATKPTTNADLAHYRQWVKVNPKPVRFKAAPATQCAQNFSQMSSPHLDKFITVYVNPIAKTSMLSAGKPEFPVGSVIVKEKYTTAKSRTPELMTVMRKHEKGYDSKNGDWEYLVLDGASQKVQAQGHLEKCQECHRLRGATDYVFRTGYLSTAQQERINRQ